MQPYKSNDYDGRFKEYAHYLRHILSHQHVDTSEDSDQEITESFRKCQGCGECLYNKSEETQAIMEFDSPSATHDAIDAALMEHSIKEITEKGEYEPLAISDKVEQFGPNGEYKLDGPIRKEIAKRIAVLFSKWVIEGEAYEPCTNEVLHIVPTDKLERLEHFDIIGEWMFIAYMGHSYKDGDEHEFPTYIDEALDAAWNCLIEFWSPDEEEDETLWQSIGEVDVVTMVEDMSAIEAWKLGKDQAALELAEEKEEMEQEEAEWERMMEVSETIWKQNFSTFNKITKKNKEAFFDKLREVLDKSTEDEVNSIYVAGFPCDYSNRMAA